MGSQADRLLCSRHSEEIWDSGTEGDQRLHLCPRVFALTTHLRIVLEVGRAWARPGAIPAQCRTLQLKKFLTNRTSQGQYVLHADQGAASFDSILSSLTKAPFVLPREFSLPKSSKITVTRNPCDSPCNGSARLP